MTGKKAKGNPRIHEALLELAQDFRGTLLSERLEAVQEVQDAIEAWIEAVTAAGNPVPRPSKAAPTLHA